MPEPVEGGKLAWVKVESRQNAIGSWQPGETTPTTDSAAIHQLLHRHDSMLFVVTTSAGPAIAEGGTAFCGDSAAGALPLLAVVPPLSPVMLGDSAFVATHGLKAAYMSGAMANGIASEALVEAMSRAGYLGSYGAAGLSFDRVNAAIDHLTTTLGDRPWCVNLIHSPNEPTHEMALAELFLKRGVTTVEASAFMDLTPAIVRYRVAGFHRDASGRPAAGNRVIAKVSRSEVATRFLSPAPMKLVQELVDQRLITNEQASLAHSLPMCDDLTAEADSGGHTDNRPAITLLPTMLGLRDRLQEQFRFAQPVRVGLAGGIATPAAVAAAFGMGAAYVVTGSINQACLESGSCATVRKMLAEAQQADVVMAPAADMFEMGVKVQVLKRGTMFAMRAQKLYDLYRAHAEWDAVPAGEKTAVEKNLFKASFDDIWRETRAFFERRDPAQAAKGDRDARHRMALVFRWYLGLSSRWANAGEPSRQMDYQVWCGPAMGAFNEWAKGTPLEAPANRTVAAVADALMEGACVELRMQALRQAGVHCSR
jgi:PfaD family protein